MYRKDSIIIEEWLKSSNKALLVTGARQIGKTWLIREEIAQSGYTKFEVNFIDQPDLVDYLNAKMSADEFLVKLKMIMPEDCKPQETIVFFDEIQKCPEIVTKIKFLVEEGSFKYVMSGSLLGVELKGIASVPVGYLTVLRMYPMDFEEYLWATGDNVTFEAMQSAFQHRKPLGDVIHRKIMQKFRTYMVVGGMPQAVNALVEGKTFAQIDFIKRNILSLYEEDLAKYDTENREKASVIFKTIPEQLENKNSHFRFSLIDKNARYQNYVDAVSFIAEAMIGNECINVTKPEVALELFADRSNFKLYMGDTGLLVTQIMRNREDTEEDLYKALIFDNLGINQGMIMENIVAQMLKAAGHDLYFHEYQYLPDGAIKEQKYEIDFLAVKKKKICPIEVKSSGYTSHKSFDYLGKKYQMKMQDKYIVYTKDLKYQDEIMYIPLYMTMFI